MFFIAHTISFRTKSRTCSLCWVQACFSCGSALKPFCMAHFLICSSITRSHMFAEGFSLPKQESIIILYLVGQRLACEQNYNFLVLKSSNVFLKLPEEDCPLLIRQARHKRLPWRELLTRRRLQKCKFEIDKKILKSYKFFKLKFEDLEITF